MLGDAAHSLRIVDAAKRSRSGKKQQRFGKLVKAVARLKDAVRAWSLAQPDLERRAAECMQLAAGHRAALAELVRVLDRAYPDRSLTKLEREYLRELLCEMSLDLLYARDCPEDVKAIYNRHSEGDFDAEVAQQDALHAQALKSMLEKTGFDFAGVDVRSMRDLQQVFHAWSDELLRDAERHRHEAEARASRRKKSARQVAAEARRELEQAQVGKALQEVYRKLAIVLHPDREPDPAEQARKTLLMQQVNVAYEQKDLLQLLELQLRLEQIDEAQIGTLAEERLARYNRLLADQAAQLKEELSELELPWRIRLELPPSARLSPVRVSQVLEDDLRILSYDIAQVQSHVQELADVRALKVWLRTEQEAEQRRVQDRLTRR